MLVISKVFLILMTLFLSACISSSAKKALVSVDESETSAKKVESITKINQSWQQVTVKYFALEGGFYGLISQKGTKLLPIKLLEKYRVDSTILRVKGKAVNNMMTIQQWGAPFDISEIELIKMGKSKTATH